MAIASSCCAFGDTVAQHFNAEKVAKELLEYRKKGPGPTTRGLRDGFLSANVRHGTVLDIGGGFGSLSFELLDAGFSRAVVVDASSAYRDAAIEEAGRRGRSDSMQFVHGDFVAAFGGFARSNAVVLDRVVCCYPLYKPLVEQALRLAQNAFAFSYPRDRWFVRLGMWFENVLRRRRGNPFRTFVHPPGEMIQLIEQAGFRLGARRRLLSWSCDVFVRIDG